MNFDFLEEIHAKGRIAHRKVFEKKQNSGPS
jgi:hypothetical protein